MRSTGVGTYTATVTAKGNGIAYNDGIESTPSGSQNIVKASTVTVLGLDTSGKATWTNVADATSYSLQLYKDGTAQGTSKASTDGSAGVNFLSEMRAAGVGEYTVKVTSKSNTGLVIDGEESVASSSQSIAKLDKVTTLTWNGNIANWTNVANAARYSVQLYKNGTPIGAARTQSDGVAGYHFGTDVTNGGTGTYTYKVTAKSAGGNLLIDSDQSEASNENVK